MLKYGLIQTRIVEEKAFWRIESRDIIGDVTIRWPWPLSYKLQIEKYALSATDI